MPTAQARSAMKDDLFGLPGDGLHWAWQRCGRYEYQKVLMHSTNPDHLVPSAPRGSGGFLPGAAPHAAGGEGRRTTRGGYFVALGARTGTPTKTRPLSRQRLLP